MQVGTERRLKQALPLRDEASSRPVLLETSSPFNSYLSKPAACPGLDSRQPTLLEAKVLVLLTPLIADSLDHTDPFEGLGRALSKHHPRVRHLPYVPGSRLTEVHKECLKRAGAVVCVLYEQPLASMTDSSSLEYNVLVPHSAIPHGDGIYGQFAFVKRLRHFLDRLDQPKAKSLVAIGPSGGVLDISDKRWAFEHVLYCLSTTPVAEVADGLFGRDSMSPSSWQPDWRSPESGERGSAAKAALDDLSL